jgi:hypothetical protein
MRQPTPASVSTATRIVEPWRCAIGSRLASLVSRTQMIVTSHLSERDRCVDLCSALGLLRSAHDDETGRPGRRLPFDRHHGGCSSRHRPSVRSEPLCLRMSLCRPALHRARLCGCAAHRGGAPRSGIEPPPHPSSGALSNSSRGVWLPLSIDPGVHCGVGGRSRLGKAASEAMSRRDRTPRCRAQRQPACSRAPRPYQGGGHECTAGCLPDVRRPGHRAVRQRRSAARLCPIRPGGAKEPALGLVGCAAGSGARQPRGRRSELRSTPEEPRTCGTEDAIEQAVGDVDREFSDRPAVQPIGGRREHRRESMAGASLGHCGQFQSLRHAVGVDVEGCAP